jgi:hypothetical protein
VKKDNYQVKEDILKVFFGGKIMNKSLVIILSITMLFLVSCGKQEISSPDKLLQQETIENELHEKYDGPEVQQKNVIKEPELPGALMVMYDNFWKARPQAGLDKADMVYEIMAEAGITRLMGIFYHQHVDKIGPIRSARYYFVQLAKGYDSPLAHAGGSTEALNMLVSLKIKDMDEIYNAGNYFWRDKNRKMPHNLYTSTERLIKGAQAKGYSFVPLELLPQGSQWTGEQELEISIDYSMGTYGYRVSWEYKSNRYERKINESPHLMEDGTAIKADNVIVITARTRNIVKDNIVLSDVDIVGEGESRYLIDGKIMNGSWIKKSEASNIEFMDETGNPMKFKTGQTWIQVIPDINSLKIE